MSLLLFCYASKISHKFFSIQTTASSLQRFDGTAYSHAVFLIPSFCRDLQGPCKGSDGGITRRRGGFVTFVVFAYSFHPPTRVES